VAVTAHSVGTPTDAVTVVVPDAVAIVQREFGVEIAYVIAPVPVPPEVVNVILVPTLYAEELSLAMLSVDWAANIFIDFVTAGAAL
jgi:hypothetical protein